MTRSSEPAKIRDSIFQNNFHTQILITKLRTCPGNSGRMATLFYVNS